MPPPPPAARSEPMLLKNTHAHNKPKHTTLCLQERASVTAQTDPTRGCASYKRFLFVGADLRNSSSVGPRGRLTGACARTITEGVGSGPSAVSASNGTASCTKHSTQTVEAPVLLFRGYVDLRPLVDVATGGLLMATYGPCKHSVDFWFF